MSIVILMAQAAGFRTLVVSQTDGTQVKIELTDEFNAWFEDGMLQVFGTPTEISIPQDKIKSFAFSEESKSGIADVEVADAAAPQVSGNRLIFKQLPAKSSVAVYDAAGRCLANATAEGDYVLSLDSLGAGLRLVTVNGVTYKIVVK